jgi:hypothetical protein
MGSPLEQVSQRVDKVTHVALPPIPASTPGGALSKANYVTSLVLQQGDVDGVLATHPPPNAAALPPTSGFSTGLADVLRRYEGSPVPSSLPEPSVFASVPVADLLAFGTALQARRSDMLAQASTNDDVNPAALGSLIGSLNSVTTANNNFLASGAVTPIGMLNLERLEMTPSGITRGDLLATIPLAPGETTSVYQKEWSVTSSEFTSIVTDSLENYSETGVTENTNLAQSTTSQNTHNNQYNVTASASGGCGFVSGSVSTSGGASNAATQSATQSRNDAVATTRQASTRVKQEHKMSISTTTVIGSGESSTRTLSNPTANAIRIDYFSMMEEWRVRLYRYGMRLTYDLTIPEPGSTLREIYAQLAQFQQQAAQQFIFPLQYSDITPEAYADPKSKLWTYASQWGAQVTAPPEQKQPFTAGGATAPIPGLGEDDDWHFYPVTFTVPDGYWITDITIDAQLGFASSGACDGSHHTFSVLGTDYGFAPPDPGSTNYGYHWDLTQWSGSPAPVNPGKPGYMLHWEGTQSITFFIQCANTGWAQVMVATEPTPTAIAQWQSNLFQTLYNAAQTAFYATVQYANGQIQALQAKISGVDTLTLRREENDEIMKAILRFLLGAWFDFMPQSVIGALESNLTIATGGSNYRVGDQVSVSGGSGTGMLLVVTQVGSGGSVAAFTVSTYGAGYSTKSGVVTTGGHGKGFTVNITVVSNDVIEHGETFAKALLSLPASALSILGNYGQSILFINEAIDWENLIFYLDSYFWDIPASWDFIRQIQHPDAQRQAFLRAGSARVVVPITKGYETAWMQFVQTGSLTDKLSADSPYMTIAQEIQDYDNTNYPGIPPANPADQSAGPASTTCSVAIGPSAAATAIPVASSAGFIVGQPATIDTGASSETQMVTALATGSITVVALSNAHDGSTTPFPVTQDNTSQSDATMAATVSTDTLSASLTPVTIGVQSSAGFIAGYTALVDSGQNAESQLILTVGNASITVQRLVNAHDGSTTAFPVAQQNEAGVLIAEWNEYTPTSGTDIAVTSNLATIA